MLAPHTWMKQMGIRSHNNYTGMFIDNIRHNYGPREAPHRTSMS